MMAVIILTRFSVQLKGKLPDESWLEHRFRLFAHITAPSVCRLSHVTSFTWVILTHPRWRERIADMIHSIELGPGADLRIISCTPLPQPLVPASQMEISDGLVERAELDAIQPEHELFLTVRLDSDDALAECALNQILQAHRDDGLSDEAVFDLPEGLQLNWNTGRLHQVTHREHYQGPFLALRNISRLTMLNSGGHHRRIREGRRVIRVRGRLWLQVIHERNLSNVSAPDPLSNNGSRQNEILEYMDFHPLPDNRRAELLAPYGVVWTG